MCINLTLGLLLTRHLTKWRPVGRRPCVTDTHVFDRMCMFPCRSSSLLLRDSIRAVQVDCNLLSKEQYAVTWIVWCLLNFIFYLSYLRTFNVNFVSICCVVYLVVGPCHNMHVSPGFSPRRPKSTPRPGRACFTVVQRGTGADFFLPISSVFTCHCRPCNAPYLLIHL